MIPPTAYIAAGGLVVAFAAGWTVRDWKADSDALEAENKAHTQFVAMSEALADQSLQYEYVAQQLRTAERTDRETIRETFRNVEVPAVCSPPAGVVSVLNDAIDRTNAATSRQSGGKVPDAP